MKHVNLLLCVIPTAPTDSIDEINFYYIVQPLVQVYNVKMVSRNSPLKAFVQVKDDDAAEVVIAATHGKITPLGKTKTFVSFQRFVNYEKPLKDILRNRQSQDKLNQDISKGQTFDKIHQVIGKSNPDIEQQKISNKSLKSNNELKLYQNDKNPVIIKNNKNAEQVFNQISKYKNGNNISLSPKNKFNEQVATKAVLNQKNKQESRLVNITHENLNELQSERIMSLFCRFGKISNKKFNAKLLVWIFEYELNESVAEIVRLAANNKLLGYQVVSSDILISEQNSSMSQVNKKFSSSAIDSIVTGSKNLSFQNVHVSCTTKVVDKRQKMKIEDICGLVSSITMPLQVAQATDLNKNHVFYLITYKNIEESIRVYRFLNDIALKKPWLKAAHVNINVKN